MKNCSQLPCICTDPSIESDHSVTAPASFTPQFGHDIEQARMNDKLNGDELRLIFDYHLPVHTSITKEGNTVESWVQSLRTLQNLGQVCKKWRYNLHEIPAYWKTLLRLQVVLPPRLRVAAQVTTSATSLSQGQSLHPGAWAQGPAALTVDLALKATKNLRRLGANVPELTFYGCFSDLQPSHRNLVESCADILESWQVDVGSSVLALDWLNELLTDHNWNQLVEIKLKLHMQPLLFGKENVERLRDVLDCLSECPELRRIAVIVEGSCVINSEFWQRINAQIELQNAPSRTNGFLRLEKCRLDVRHYQLSRFMLSFISRRCHDSAVTFELPWFTLADTQYYYDHPWISEVDTVSLEIDTCRDEVLAHLWTAESLARTSIRQAQPRMSLFQAIVLLRDPSEDSFRGDFDHLVGEIARYRRGTPQYVDGSNVPAVVQAPRQVAELPPLPADLKEGQATSPPPLS